MRHGSLMWRVYKTEVDICAPSIRAAVATFLFGGPLLCGPVWIFMSWGVADTPGGMLRELFLAPIVAPVGFLGWWNWVLQPRNALVTWIPTLAAGLACGYLLRLLVAWLPYQRVARVLKLIAAATVCAITSALIYETTWRISEYIGTIPMPTSPKFFARGGGVPIVTVIGFILGAYLTWQATRVNTTEPSNN